MKKLLPSVVSALIVFCICLFTGSNQVATQTPKPGPEPQRYVPNEILVKLKDDIVWELPENRYQIQNVIELMQGKVITCHNQDIRPSAWEPGVITQRSFIGDPWLLHIRIPKEIGTDYAISYLKSLPFVEYAEKNGVAYLDDCPPPPTNDEYICDQWGLFNIHAPEAWQTFNFTGSSDVVVAVLDSGIDVDHEDLAANLWSNPNDPAGNGDDDNNNYVDDVNGWNFVAGSAAVDDDNTEGLLYHGTSCAGIIGAVGNNTHGISGVCWNVKIMPVKIYDSSMGITSVANVVKAIDYAITNGASLISASWHYTVEYLSVKYAIGRAMNKNVLYVCSSGHPEHESDGWNIDAEGGSYPSLWTLDNILSVLATVNAAGDKDAGSFYGETSVDIGAPGYNIKTTKGDPVYRYEPFGGTSAAAPHVTGAAALALGICPGLTSSRLKSLITAGVTPVENLSDYCHYGGKLNVYNVINAIGGTTSPGAPSNLTACPTAWNIIRLSWHDNSNNEVGFEIQKKDQYQSLAFIHDNCADMNSTATAVFQDESIDPYQERTYTYRVRATNRAGTSSFTNTAAASVPKTAPDPPTDFECQSAVYPNVHLSWSDIANNELHYFVERRTSGNGSWSVLATLICNNNAYTDSSVQRGRTYDYRLRAGNPIGYSSYSDIITVEVVDW